MVSEVVAFFKQNTVKKMKNSSVPVLPVLQILRVITFIIPTVIVCASVYLWSVIKCKSLWWNVCIHVVYLFLCIYFWSYLQKKSLQYINKLLVLWCVHKSLIVKLTIGLACPTSLKDCCHLHPDFISWMDQDGSFFLLSHLTFLVPRVGQLVTFRHLRA